MEPRGERDRPGFLPPAELTERVELGQFSIRLRRPADAEGLIDEERFDTDEFLPYWAELWPSGLALARHLAGLELTGTTVLEVGCGLGLPSLVAALAGADVLATDWAPEALALLQRNASENGARVACRLLRFDDPAAVEDRCFDLVLAADVLYEARNAAPLLALLDVTVAADGVALVADPGRRHATAFFEQAGRSGWACERAAAGLLPRGGLHRLQREAPGPKRDRRVQG